MQRVVPVAETRGDAVELGANSRRLIGGQLLFDRDVQAHMKEWIRFAALRLIVAIQEPLGVIQHRVILRMQQDDLESDCLKTLEGLARAVLGPRVEEELTALFACWIEHKVVAQS